MLFSSPSPETDNTTKLATHLTPQKIFTFRGAHVAKMKDTFLCTWSSLNIVHSLGRYIIKGLSDYPLSLGKG